VRIEAFPKLGEKLIGDGKEFWSIDDRIPDLSDKPKAIRNGELADFCDVSHGVIVSNASHHSQHLP
jgi:hypothetical protein